MKKIVLLLLFSVICFGEEAINFNIVAVGNLKGEQNNLPKYYSMIEGLRDKETILLDVGNNLDEFYEKKDVYRYFFTKLNADFRLYGEREYLYDKSLEAIDNYISLNVYSDYIKPYRLFVNSDKVFAIVGISNLYSYDKKFILNHEKELKKLIYKIEEDVDFLIVVSDLSRAENVRLIKKFNNIAMIVESGDDKSLSLIEEFEGSYILPVNNFLRAEFRYDVNSEKKSIKPYEEYSLKKVNILKIEEAEKFIGFDDNEEIAKYIESKKEELSSVVNEVLGLNEESYFKEEVRSSKRIKFLDKLLKKILYSYGVDFSGISYKTIASGLNQGLYTYSDIERAFLKNRIVKVKVSKKGLDKIITDVKSKIGTDDYIYFSDESLMDNTLKERYIILTEDSLENYKNEIIDYEIMEVNMLDILRRE